MNPVKVMWQDLKRTASVNAQNPQWTGAMFKEEWAKLPPQWCETLSKSCRLQHLQSYWWWRWIFKLLSHGVLRITHRLFLSSFCTQIHWGHGFWVFFVLYVHTCARTHTKQRIKRTVLTLAHDCWESELQRDLVRSGVDSLVSEGPSFSEILQLFSSCCSSSHSNTPAIHTNNSDSDAEEDIQVRLHFDWSWFKNPQIPNYYFFVIRFIQIFFVCSARQMRSVRKMSLLGTEVKEA